MPRRSLTRPTGHENVMQALTQLVDEIENAGVTVAGTALSDGAVPVWDATKRRWVPSDTKAIEGRHLAWHRGTSPPGSPGLGDIWIYPFDPGSGVGTTGYWMFAYDPNETTYKWKFVGGGDGEIAISTDETFTDDSTLHDPATTGPVFTLPRAGDYAVESKANMYYATQSAGSFRGVGAVPVLSSGTWDDTGTANASSQAITTAGIAVDSIAIDVAKGVSASATITLRYIATTDTGTAHTRNRVLRVRPVRVS